MHARAVLFAAGLMVVCAAPSATAIAQNAPQPYPTVLVSLPPAPATPSPDPATLDRVLSRERLLACINERKLADAALVDTAKGDGVVSGVMRRLGETRFTLDDLTGDQIPDSQPTPPAPGMQAGPTPLPFETPISTFIIARDAARDSSKPYWTGTRKLLDASGDLENAVKAAAVAVDKLQAAVNVDPDPARRKQIQDMISSLSSAIIKQAPLVKDVEQFILKADTNLSVGEMRNAGTMGGANPQYPVNSALLNNDPDSDGYKLLHQATDAHDATVKAIKLATDLNGAAFAECAAPHPQATPATKR